MRPGGWPGPGAALCRLRPDRGSMGGPALLLEQAAPERLVEQAVRSEERPRVDAAAVLQVGRPAAGLLDEQHRRGSIPWRQLDLDHRLCGALGEQRVSPEIAEAPFAPDVAEQVIKPRRAARRDDVPARAVQDEGVLEATHRRDGDATCCLAAVAGPG